jgi:hypothetical protein
VREHVIPYEDVSNPGKICWDLRIFTSWVKPLERIKRGSFVCGNMGSLVERARSPAKVTTLQKVERTTSGSIVVV